jgi:hypothetical protein
MEGLWGLDEYGFGYSQFLPFFFRQKLSLDKFRIVLSPGFVDAFRMDFSQHIPVVPDRKKVTTTPVFSRNLSGRFQQPPVSNLKAGFNDTPVIKNDLI